MNSCEFYQELISSMADGELSAEEQAVLVPHLEHCPDCAALYEAFQSISGLIAGDLAEPPEVLSENVMAELRRADIRAKSRKQKYWKGPLATAACLAVVIAAAWLMPNLFRAGSAAPAEMPAATSDQAAPRAEAYAVPAEGIAPAPAGTDSVSAPEAGAQEAAVPAESAEIGSVDEAPSEEPDVLPAQFTAGSREAAVEGEFITLEGDSAASFAALLNGDEAQLPAQQEDAACTVCYSIEQEEYRISLRIFGQQVYYSLDGSRFYLSSFAKSDFAPLIFPKNS